MPLELDLLQTRVPRILRDSYSAALYAASIGLHYSLD